MPSHPFPEEISWLEPWIVPGTLAALCAFYLVKAWQRDRRSGTRGFWLTVISCTLFCVAAALYGLGGDDPRGAAFREASKWVGWVWLAWVFFRAFGLHRAGVTKTLEGTPSRMVCVLLGDRRLHEAEALGRALLARNPADAVAGLYTAVALQRLDRRDEAASRLAAVDIAGLEDMDREVHAQMHDARENQQSQPRSRWVGPAMMALVGLLAGISLSSKLLGESNPWNPAIAIGCSAAGAVGTLWLRRRLARGGPLFGPAHSAPVVVTVIQALRASGEPELAETVGKTRLARCPEDEGVRRALEAGAKG